MNTGMVFEFKSKEDYWLAIYIAKNKPDVKNEDFDYCVLRERGIEVLSCLNNNIPYEVYTTDGELLASTMSQDNHNVLYRGRTDTFKLPENRLSFETKESIDKILNWPEYVSSKYTKRYVKIVSHDKMADIILNGINEEIFIKTKDKGRNGSGTFHKIINRSECFKVDCDTSIQGIFDQIVDDSRIICLIEGESYYNEYMDEW